MVRVGPVIEAFARYGCRFVVVGSAARSLRGEGVVPHDLDLLVDGSPERRAALIAALTDLSARIRAGERWVPVDPTVPLPWAWGFRVRTRFGPVDVTTCFADGTTIDSLTIDLPGCPA